MPAKNNLSQQQLAQSSRRIMDAQNSIHKNLEQLVTKHFSTDYQKPIAQHTQDAFDAVKQQVSTSLAGDHPLIFDSCCGTAMSTGIIAQQNSHALVVGIDRSAARLSKEYNKSMPKNVLLVQAECSDFWSLAVAEGWKLDKHFILYPNPYPKSKHLKRRWHGHPAFPLLFSLGGSLILRSNWSVYVEEFCMALEFGLKSRPVEKLNQKPIMKVVEPKTPLTLFEKKYQESGQSLYQCEFRL